MRLLGRNLILRPVLGRARKGMKRHVELAGAVAEEGAVRGERVRPEGHFEGDGFGGVGGVGGEEARVRGEGKAGEVVKYVEAVGGERWWDGGFGAVAVEEVCWGGGEGREEKQEGWEKEEGEMEEGDREEEQEMEGG